MKKPLDKCCNGCDAPPHPPSWVLCKACFAALSAKFDRLAEGGAGALREDEEKARRALAAGVGGER